MGNRIILNTAFICVAAIFLFSCSKANEGAPSLNAGKHPAGWAIAGTGGAHPAAYLDNPAQCRECHGQDLKGGISGVSCFSATFSGITCHPNGPSGHPTGWADPDSHGEAAKSLVGGMNGFVACKSCHGSDFSGGNIKKSCFECHKVKAPHSPKPWRSSIGGRTHVDTDTSNAATCGDCHTKGANSSRKPSQAAPTGTAPGCFNNTLCHGVEGHPVGWKSRTAHGAAAKGVASKDKGFVYCTQCHGGKYDGGSAEQSCLNNSACHGANVNAPHAKAPWRSASGSTHTTTDLSNAGQCSLCHRGGANSTLQPTSTPAASTSAGCYNNTLCHGTIGHATGWSAPSQHGAEAKKAPAGGSGFAGCQPCHGTSFNNGTAPSCMNNASCHGSDVSAPHSRKPWSSKTGGPTHTNTAEKNAVTCSICHTAGANSTIIPPTPGSGNPGCFNNTLCHFHQIPYAPTATIPASLHGGEAKKDLTICQNCHGNKGTTAFDGKTLANGAKTVACSSCHAFAKAHPTDWQGAGSYSHRTAGNIASACSLCHDVSLGRTAPLSQAPSCSSATFSNGAGQSRTCHAGGPGHAPHNVPYNNHNATARGNIDYCLGCHQVAADVPLQAGGVIPRCLTCHLTSPVATPSGCTSCHSKPPAGTTYPDIAASHGAHGAINVPENATLTGNCDACHNGLGLGTVDHLNRARLRTASVQTGPVVFGPLAMTGGLAPSYTDATKTCGNTYCHGNTLDKPATAILAPSWGTPFLNGTAANDCVKCHGYPPATAIHTGKTPTQCIGCHAHLNSSGTGFTDPTKHINGIIEATGGHGFPNPGSAHKSATNGTGCIAAGCHAFGTGTFDSPYPVTIGTPPNCRACHLNATPTVDPHCSDCHGSSANDAAGLILAGRPTGAAFPNRLGQHNRSEHRVACIGCHLFGTGDTRHGWSNRLKSTAARVGGTGTNITSWDLAGNAGRGSCLPTCHGSQAWY